jgi:hypothetical protein
VTKWEAAAGAVAVAATAAVAVRAYMRSRVTPTEAERLRRSALAQRGKLGDATVHEAQDGHLLFSYDVHGVTYTASQDVSALGERIPAGGEGVFGPVLVKYDPKNPANSIVVSEEWSGFRNTQSRD